MRTSRTRLSADMPIDTDDMLAFARMDGTDDEGIFDDAITAAVDFFEVETNLLLTPNSVTAVMDGFPVTTRPASGQKRYFELLQGPVTAITAITYLDQQGNSQPFTGFVFDQVGQRIILAPSQQCFPLTFDGPATVTLTYASGYAADAVPGMILQCLKMLALHFYENRDVTDETARKEVPLSARSIMANNTEAEFV